MTSIKIAAYALRGELFQLDRDWFGDETTAEQQMQGLKILVSLIDANLSELCGFGQRPRCVAALVTKFNDDLNHLAIRDTVIAATTLIYDCVRSWTKAETFVAAAATGVGFRGNMKEDHEESFTARTVKSWRSAHRSSKYGHAPSVAIENARARLRELAGPTPSTGQVEGFVKELLLAAFIQLRSPRIEKDT